ncbi:hypothetical protein GAPWK_1181 [Gilliamella apicola]|nr:hypothetical protein [Gilliamella apicola]AHN25758.1 hypothetical protein GAPWK_1181 [Gilliamella apicola]
MVIYTMRSFIESKKITYTRRLGNNTTFVPNEQQIPDDGLF